MFASRAHTHTRQQAAFGRVFAGDAFIADPPSIVFKDVVPGATYTAAVQLTNRSCSSNSIRLGEVPAEVLHVLEVVMPPSGSLAPGAAATLRITFKPQVCTHVHGCLGSCMSHARQLQPLTQSAALVSVPHGRLTSR
jgi:hypothetical protein